MPSQITQRRQLHFNLNAKDWVAPKMRDWENILQFHQDFPGYSPTPLISLPFVAETAGVCAVYVKNESNRCGLPAFKILGASWGTYRAITQRLGLPLDTTLGAIQQVLLSSSLTLYAATDGNHGRAVARLASLLAISAEIHVPRYMKENIVELIAQEGANVIVSNSDYDSAVKEAFTASQHPGWIVDGYGTLMHEIDEQLFGKSPDLVIVPLGVGSFAQSVVAHYKQPGSCTSVMTVEPDTAACLWKRLVRGDKSCVQSTPTIMAGLDCSTVSEQSWPLLQKGVDVSATISDFEAPVACETLHKSGVDAGPCGAASLAALRRLTAQDRDALGLDRNSTVVLLSTEGLRAYDVPSDVSEDDPVALRQALVRISSANPSLRFVSGPFDAQIAKFICSWLEYRDIDAHWVEPVDGRPAVVGVAKDTCSRRYLLLLNDPKDTTTFMGSAGNTLEPKIEDGTPNGRGSTDMKAGLAAQMTRAADFTTSFDSARPRGEGSHARVVDFIYVDSVAEISTILIGIAKELCA